jgi:hypothetical protein
VKRHLNAKTMTHQISPLGFDVLASLLTSLPIVQAPTVLNSAK